MTKTMQHNESSTRPGRRTERVAIGVVAAVVLTGVAVGTSRAAFGGEEPVRPASAATPSAAPAVIKPAATSSAAPSAVPSATPWVVADTERPGPGGPGAGHQPGGPYVKEFGFVTASTRSGGTVRITVDRAEYLTGAAARAYYDAHPEKERLEVAVVNDSTRLRTYVLDGEAQLYGTVRLGNGTSEPVPALVADLLAWSGTPIAVDLVHAGSATGPVTHLSETYLP